MRIRNEIYTGANGRRSLIDLATPTTDFSAVVLFIHGYKGYKDWGAWNLVQSYFVENEVAFCKFNLSHNGGTTEQPIDFPDLDAFAENTYSYEVTDTLAAIKWLGERIDLTKKRLYLMGHSRGGGISLLTAQHPLVYGVITWAAISDIGARFPSGEALEQWKNDGIYYVKNSRTQQEMPQRYCIYEDWLANKAQLDIESHARKLHKPALHIHGENDSTVDVEEVKKIAGWTNGEVFIQPSANHTFGAQHPYSSTLLPKELLNICKLTLAFIEK